jgi:hypothetical protein
MGKAGVGTTEGLLTPPTTKTAGSSGVPTGEGSYMEMESGKDGLSESGCWVLEEIGAR